MATGRRHGDHRKECKNKVERNARVCLPVVNVCVMNLCVCVEAQEYT